MRVGARIDAAFELTCDSADACAAVEKLILKKRLDLSRDLSLRMIGLGPVVDSLATSQENGGARLRVTAGAEARQLADTVERVLRWKARKEAAKDAKGDAIPPPVPHETLRAPTQTGVGADAGHL
jgi:hypothetical protein